MSRIAWMVIAVCLSTACAGNHPESGTPAAGPNGQETAEYRPVAGSEITVGDDGRTTVLSVGEFDANTGSLAGLVAVEGRVSESFADRDVFILVDVANEPGCGKGCCSQAKVPVQLAAGSYTGRLPGAGEPVIVIGDLTVTESGYRLDVIETRRGSETLLRTDRTAS